MRSPQEIGLWATYSRCVRKQMRRQHNLKTVQILGNYVEIKYTKNALAHKSFWEPTNKMSCFDSSTRSGSVMEATPL